jgi:hypothetical protein
MAHSWIVFSWVLASAGCGDDAATVDAGAADAASADAGATASDGGASDGGGAPDAGARDAGPPPDAGEACASSADCDDGLFCNGTESCGPGGVCVTTPRPCDEPAYRCVEDLELCFVNCEVDSDRDGDGDPARECSGMDCDDEDPTVYFGAEETCNEVDDDCDLRADEDAGPWYFADRDGDGYGFEIRGLPMDRYARQSCTPIPDYVTTAGDCDDRFDFIHSGAMESPGDGTDENCDGVIECWADADGDRSGGAATVASADADCFDPGESESSRDCDDTNPDVRPGATEVTADGIDQNCDGREVCYVDADDDGYRLDTTVTSTDADCADGGEATASDRTGDCCDRDDRAHPGRTSGEATETICGGWDYDCNGVTTHDLGAGRCLDVGGECRTTVGFEDGDLPCGSIGYRIDICGRSTCIPLVRTRTEQTCR